MRRVAASLAVSLFLIGGSAFVMLPKASAKAAHLVGVFPDNMSGTSTGGYMLYSDGRVVPLQGAPYYGNGLATRLTNFVALITDPLGNGYWIVTANGKHFARGTTCTGGEVLQGPAHIPANVPIVGAINPSGSLNEGFDLVASTGRVYSYQCNFNF